jgi:phosphate transport system protein
MREAYHDQLSQLIDQLADMCGMVGDAMERATQALLDADLALAEQVISDDANVDMARASCEEYAYSLLALQAPVATDLRQVLAAIHAAESLERMGDLALHVAKAARRRHPQPVLPDEVQEQFSAMGRVAVSLARQTQQVIRNQDVTLAQSIEQTDDEIDELHRNLFSVVMAKEWQHGVAAAVDITLLGRFYERYADHAVSVARRVIFVVTAKMPGYETDDI